ncbi:hypothetical protein EVAR_17565_1 [Eumeta japonica]|uniref:Uncharacterized protein n=1 Tax=Eumeta variegata TaxID=151549 RepID=A0A4C1UC39_EUMVA|nr:hypothetical protein EVAR_17565_1 [Eumeta japonica]
MRSRARPDKDQAADGASVKIKTPYPYRLKVPLGKSSRVSELAGSPSRCQSFLRVVYFKEIHQAIRLRFTLYLPLIGHLRYFSRDRGGELEKPPREMTLINFVRKK